MLRPRPDYASELLLLRCVGGLYRALVAPTESALCRVDRRLLRCQPEVRRLLDLGRLDDKQRYVRAAIRKTERVFTAWLSE